MLSEADNQHMRRLSWDEPFSLDITDIDPDISYYKVCFNLVATGDNKSQCVLINQTEFSFPYISIPLPFTVSAVNVVRAGNPALILYDGNGCANMTDLPSINASKIKTHVSLSKLLVARFLFQQLFGEINGITCFPVYKIESSAANTTVIDHGIEIPEIVQYSRLSVQLSLTVDSNLVDNERYLVIITAINTNGERGHSVTVEFDTYDVQSVSGRAIPGGLDLSCTFADGSQAQSCTLTIYRILENGMDRFIDNITISREDRPQASSGRILSLELGEYVVRQVAEVESDGQVTIHRRSDVLSLMITEPAPTTTSESNISSTSGVSGSPAQNIGPIVGGTVLAMLLFAGITATLIVFVIVACHRHKLYHTNQETPQAVYEEPYDWAVSRLPQTEPVMEQCPAYGVLTK